MNHDSWFTVDTDVSKAATTATLSISQGDRFAAFFSRTVLGHSSVEYESNAKEEAIRK